MLYFTVSGETVEQISIHNVSRNRGRSHQATDINIGLLFWPQEMVSLSHSELFPSNPQSHTQCVVIWLPYNNKKYNLKSYKLQIV